jgi:uncharacterized protein (TIGR02270 family)
MSGASGAASPADAILWDVAEEHVDEAEFGVEQFEGALESPTRTLKDLANGTEARLLAHVDGIVVGGRPVYERLLEPVLREPDSAEPARLIAAALVAIEAGCFEDLWPALGHDDPVVRAAAVRACGLAGASPFEAWLLDGLQPGLTGAQRASLLAIAASRRLTLPGLLVEWLQSQDSTVAMAAAQAARFADPAAHLPAVEWLLEHADRGVREAALVTAWTWGSSRAPLACERWALGDGAPRLMPMVLYAALGGSVQHARLAQLLAHPTRRHGALFALGFSGDVTQLSTLAGYLDSDDRVTAKIAAQAISMITGLDLQAAATPASASPRPTELPAPAQDPDAMRALPPLDEDDLDADLVPPPEDALPTPDPRAIRGACDQAAARMSPGERYLGGRAFTPEVVFDYLELAPMRRRHLLALSFAIRSRGRAWVDTRGFSRGQLAQIAALRAAGRSAR